MKTNRNNMLIGTLMLIFLSVFLTGAVNAQSRGPAEPWDCISSDDVNILNGLDFRGKIGMFGDKDAKDEELRFRDGILYSSMGEENDFLPAKYAIKKGIDDYTICFCAESTNGKGDKILWHGKIKLDHTGLTKRHKIEAYTTLVNDTGDSQLFWVKGEASKQSMKYSGKNAPQNMQTASKEDD